MQLFAQKHGHLTAGPLYFPESEWQVIVEFRLIIKEILEFVTGVEDSSYRHSTWMDKPRRRCSSLSGCFVSSIRRWIPLPLWGIQRHGGTSVYVDRYGELLLGMGAEWLIPLLFIKDKKSTVSKWLHVVLWIWSNESVCLNGQRMRQRYGPELAGMVKWILRVGKDFRKEGLDAMMLRAINGLIDGISLLPFPMIRLYGETRLP